MHGVNYRRADTHVNRRADIFLRKVADWKYRQGIKACSAPRIGIGVPIAQIIGMAIMQGMTPQELIDYFGSQSAAAAALGITQPSVWDWLQAGEIPESRQYQIQLATDGALRADKPALRNPA